MTDHLPEAILRAIAQVAGYCDCEECRTEPDPELSAAILAYGEQRYREGVEAATTCISCGKSGVHLKCEGFC